MIEVRPTVLNFSEPMKTLEALVLQKKLAHDSEPRMSVLSAGQLNHRIRIQQPTTVKDSLGAPTQVWTDVATVWADIQPLSGREARIADRVSAELTHQITVRHRPDLNDPQAVSRMRVLFRGRTFAIHAALNDDEANVSVILLASEGIRDG